MIVGEADCTNGSCVIFTTSILAEGQNVQNVSLVVVAGGAHGGIVQLDQMAGRAGRPGSEARNPRVVILLAPDYTKRHYGDMADEVLQHFPKEYEAKAVPESRRVGKIAFDDVSEVDFDKKTKPLLIIGGSVDRIIPASLNYKNFQAYSDSKSLTEFKMFDGRCHWILEQDGWKEVAEFVDNWIHKSASGSATASANASR